MSFVSLNSEVGLSTSILEGAGERFVPKLGFSDFGAGLTAELGIPAGRTLETLASSLESVAGGWDPVTGESEKV